MICEPCSSPTTRPIYIYGPGGLPVEQVTGSTTLYLHHDQLGSTRLVTDSAGATGTATTTTYHPFGNQTSTSGSLTTNLMFGGQYLDAESGLYYLRARYYDPTTAQFLNHDPAVAETLSPYGYASSNPLNGVDRSGLACIPGDIVGCQGPMAPSGSYPGPDPANSPYSPGPDLCASNANIPPRMAVNCPQDVPPVSPGCNPPSSWRLGGGWDTGPVVDQPPPAAWVVPGQHLEPTAPHAPPYDPGAGPAISECVTTAAETGGVALELGGEVPIIGWVEVGIAAAGGCAVGALEGAAA